MARPRKTDYFVCKTCKNEFRKKAYTSEVVERCQCPQCHTKEMTKKDEEIADDKEFYKLIKSDEFNWEHEDGKIKLLTNVSIPYPQSPSKPYLSKNRDVTSTQARKYAEELDAYDKALPEFHKKIEEYNKAKNKADKWFKKWAIEEYLSIDIPVWQKDKIFALARETSDGSGYQDILRYVRDLADLFRKDEK